MKLADSFPLFFDHCWENHTISAKQRQRVCRQMTKLELISMLHLKATLSNIHMALKTSNNACIAGSLSSHELVYCVPLSAVITTQHFSQIEVSSLNQFN